MTPSSTDSMRDKAVRNLVIGALSLFAGIAITLGSDGGVVAYGAILVGFIELIVGWGQMRRAPLSPRGIAIDDANGGTVVENVRATWSCPKCTATNANTSFVCGHCRYSLM